MRDNVCEPVELRGMQESVCEPVEVRNVKEGVCESLEPGSMQESVRECLGSLETCKRASVSLVSLFKVSHYARAPRARWRVCESGEPRHNVVRLAMLASLVSLVSFKSVPA